MVVGTEFNKAGKGKSLDKIAEIEKKYFRGKTSSGASSSAVGAGKGAGGHAAELTGLSEKQLDKKFKHAADFGVTTTKKNPETLGQFASAIKEHMADANTANQGTYGFVADSKVFFNRSTNNAVVLDKTGEFVTGFKLSPGTPQFENFIKNGVLR